MNDSLLLSVKKFLETRVVSGRPLLIGYSGGPDSKALLFLMLECRRFVPFELQLAHVDHGWRKESSKEAEEIIKEAASLNLTLHLKCLHQKDFHSNNLEEQGRNYRLNFFFEVYQSIGAQALLLGHHADDQAETILKRLFEGAPIFSLKGLRQETLLKQMNIWRPLLYMDKKRILKWLSQKKLNYFQDPTNHSSRFLRGRIREEIFPLLTASFGKEIKENLCQIGEESQEIVDYFNQLNDQLLKKFQQASQGTWVDLKAYLPIPSIQLKYLIKEWLRKEGVTFSRQIIEGIVRALNQRSLQKKFSSKEGEFQINNGCFYYSKKQALVKLN